MSIYEKIYVYFKEKMETEYDGKYFKCVKNVFLVL